MYQSVDAAMFPCPPMGIWPVCGYSNRPMRRFGNFNLDAATADFLGTDRRDLCKLVAAYSWKRIIEIAGPRGAMMPLNKSNGCDAQNWIGRMNAPYRMCPDTLVDCVVR